MLDRRKCSLSVASELNSEACRPLVYARLVTDPRSWSPIECASTAAAGAFVLPLCPAMTIIDQKPLQAMKHTPSAGCMRLSRTCWKGCKVSTPLLALLHPSARVYNASIEGAAIVHQVHAALIHVEVPRQ